MDERIFFFIVLLAIVGLLVVWLTAKSALVLYGSLGVVLLILVLWGVVRINRINRIEKERTLQVKAMQSESSE